MEKRYIVRVDYNWFFSNENGEEFSSAKIGQNGVTEIRYYSPRHECECPYCEIDYENGYRERIFNINRVYEEPVAAIEPKSEDSGKNSGKITILATASEIASNLLSDINNGVLTNALGERTSDYYTFLVNGNGECICMQLTEEIHALEEAEYFYTLHLVDDISGKYCEVYFSDAFTEESVTKMVAEVINSCLMDIVKLVATAQPGTISLGRDE